MIDARQASLLIRNFDLARINAVNDIMWRLSVNCAPNTLCCSQNFLDTTIQLLRQRLRRACNMTSSKVTFLFLTVTRRLWKEDLQTIVLTSERNIPLSVRITNEEAERTTATAAYLEWWAVQ
jgi:hypothetical protein